VTTARRNGKADAVGRAEEEGLHGKGQVSEGGEEAGEGRS
jgi:hypothetical protein